MAGGGRHLKIANGRYAGRIQLGASTISLIFKFTAAPHRQKALPGGECNALANIDAIVAVLLEIGSRVLTARGVRAPPRRSYVQKSSAARARWSGRSRPSRNEE